MCDGKGSPGDISLLRLVMGETHCSFAKPLQFYDEPVRVPWGVENTFALSARAFYLVSRIGPEKSQ